MNRLTLVRRIPGTRPTRAVFRCECGTEKEFLCGNVASGRSRSCGCLNREMSAQRRLDNIEAFTGARRRHGHTEAPTWKSWQAMIQRCTNKRRDNYRYYGGRGVRVCDRWTVYENFLADMGERPDGMTLDRIDPDGDYEPANCRWATWVEQRSNRSADNRSATK